MPAFLMQLMGWMPAVIYPVATLLQFIKIWKAGSECTCVSPWAWFLFGLASMGLYVHIARWSCPQLVCALLVPAILDFMIVGLVLGFAKKRLA